MSTIVNKIRKTCRNEWDANPLSTVFLIVVITFFTIFLIYCITTDGRSLNRILFFDRSDTFMDYFNSVVNSSYHPYTGKHPLIYPPLSVLFYATIGHFTIPFASGSAAVLRNSQMGIMSFFVITLLTFYLLYLVYSKIMEKTNNRKEIIFIFIMILSFPFIYTIERGNSIILTLVFCLIFLVGYKSENKYVRYLAYVSLGCATGFKIYPIMLWLLVLREREYKEALMSALIIITFMFVPFIFTDGTPRILFDTIIRNVEYSSSNSPNIKNLNQFSYYIFQNKLGLPESTVSNIGYLILGIFTFLSFAVILFDKKMKFWKVVTLISCNLVLGLGMASPYLLIYMAMPITFFLSSEKEMTKNNIFYLICFLMAFVLIPVLTYENYLRLHSIRTMFIIIAAVALIIEGIVDIRRNWKKNHVAKTRSQSEKKSADS